MPTAPLQPMRDTLSALGFVRVHTWYESHGDGGSEFWQDKSLFEHNGNVSVTVLNFDRGHRLTGFRKESGQNYLMAQEIEGDKSGRWEKVEHSDSACGTAGITFYQDMHSWEPWEFWAVVCVAGHGKYAWQCKEADIRERGLQPVSQED